MSKDTTGNAGSETPLDFYLNPVKTPLVMGCLFIGGLAVITACALFHVPVEYLTVALLIYVVTSPLWIYKILKQL